MSVSPIRMKSLSICALGLVVLSTLASCSSKGGANSGTPAPDSGTSDICQVGCVATIAAHCSNGPTDQSSCVGTCEALRTGTCSTQYVALQNCAEGKAITCDSTGMPVIDACATEQSTFIVCEN